MKGFKASLASAVKLSAIGAAVAVCLSAGAYAQATYPDKPITLIVGSSPGGSNDVFARALAKHMGDALKQSVVVENRPSGGGVLANSLVSKADPDGYTLGMVSSTFTTGAAIRDNLGYDAVKSFTPVAMIAKGPLLVTVNNDQPFKTIQELVQYAQANPGKLNYGTSGIGSINQFATEVFLQSADVKMTHVPYKGMGPATNDLIGGQIQVLVASAPSIGGQVKSGHVRALAVTTAQRSPVAPDLPSLEEAGYKGSTADLWWGVIGPAGMPADVTAKLNQVINNALASDEMKAFLIKEGAEAAPMSSAAFGKVIADELANWKAVAEKSGIKPE
ncbi:Bug family tripartite tricarboxylate transporter substrate binding protein [Bordetella sp. 02P26C-1]|uniref:Bug family tripartite tricarboxylate transporter substrate binding protein n=1 Tax=Bordetella sp. 02P26C-1 TaxID=2683195 RepID=UPI001355AFC9|nr:tripartite tricarboxylate transporter substrate binding protein [Bordetella sp. 02P26C-1]MVW79440.1 tripartite tricarboxylate transporter substrate binding protein [Bordetella sp. 02P26C-1]